MNVYMDRGSPSESHWLSEMEKSKGRQGEKRKMNKKNGNKKKRVRNNTSRLPGKQKSMISRIHIVNFE